METDDIDIYTYLDLPNGSVTDLSMHHPSGFNWQPLEGAGRYIYITLYI